MGSLSQSRSHRQGSYASLMLLLVVTASCIFWIFNTETSKPAPLPTSHTLPVPNSFTKTAVQTYTLLTSTSNQLTKMTSSIAKSWEDARRNHSANVALLNVTSMWKDTQMKLEESSECSDAMRWEDFKVLLVLVHAHGEAGAALLLVAALLGLPPLAYLVYTKRWHSALLVLLGVVSLVLLFVMQPAMAISTDLHDIHKSLMNQASVLLHSCMPLSPVHNCTCHTV